MSNHAFLRGSKMSKIIYFAARYLALYQVTRETKHFFHLWNYFACLFVPLLPYWILAEIMIYEVKNELSFWFYLYTPGMVHWMWILKTSSANLSQSSQRFRTVFIFGFRVFRLLGFLRFWKTILVSIKNLQTKIFWSMHGNGWFY